MKLPEPDFHSREIFDAVTIDYTNRDLDVTKGNPGRTWYDDHECLH